MVLAPDNAPELRASYEALDPREALGADVLAAVVFGSETPCPPDPRCLRIGLEPVLGAGLVEVWRGSGDARVGTMGPIRYVEDGKHFAGWIDLDESRFESLVEAAEAAYLGLLSFHASSPYRHVWRLWNFITDINDGPGDTERYKLFCLGRARAFAAAHAKWLGIGYPAASAVGKVGGARTLQVCWFAGREPGLAVENPRQVSAYHYPRRYGPAAPSFSRAIVAPGPLLLVSGTASIVGHASMHRGDTLAQLRETLANLDMLLQRAHASGALLSARFEAASLLKVYLRHGGDAAIVDRCLREHFGDEVAVLAVVADICRADLSIEIEAVHPG